MIQDSYRVLRAVDSGADIRDMNLRVVDYARVSTASIDQRKSFENQLDTYRQMIDDNPNWTYAGTYSDEAISGTKVYLRGGFQQMLADAEDGKFDLIIVKSIARFARSLKDSLNAKDRLKSYGVMVFFVENNLNTFRKNDDMIFQFLAMGAEMEAKSARDRTKIVFEQGIRKGKVYGNSKILGYTKDHCTLVIDEDEAEIVRLIFDLYVHKRMGLRRIAKELADRNITRKDGSAIPTRTLKTVLENPKYKGYYCGGKTEKLDMGERYVRRDLPESEWVMYKDPAIPVIVSEALWDEAARIRQERQDKYREEVSAPCNQGIYRYSGKIESGFAPGVNYTRTLYKYKGIAREAWQCRNHKDWANPSNVGPTLYSDELDAIIHNVLNSMLGGYDSIIDDLMARYQDAKGDSQGKKRLAVLENERQKIFARQEKLLELYEDDVLTREAFIVRNKEHKTRLDALDSEITALRNTADTTKDILAELDNLKAAITATAQEIHPSKETIDTLIDKILVRADSTKNHINLDIILRVTGLTQTFTVIRGPKKRACNDGDENSCICCSTGTSTPASPSWPSSPARAKSRTAARIASTAAATPAAPCGWAAPATACSSSSSGCNSSRSSTPTCRTLRWTAPLAAAPRPRSRPFRKNSALCRTAWWVAPPGTRCTPSI